MVVLEGATGRMNKTSALGIALACCAALSACSSTVIREPGGGGRAALPAGRPGATTVVQRGDTLYGVASRNGIALRDLAAWNGIEPPYTIYPGQRLRLYPPGARPGPRRPSTGSATRPANTGPSAAAKPATAPATPGAAPRDSGIAWRWPAEGTLLNRFVVGDPTRQGVDIAGSGGAAVRSAADGTVVYSGSGLVGYGELIIVKHNDAWLSAYGHNRKRLVNEGQLVKAGEQIAEMGRSGAARDMLHFEIRYNGKPVDPLLYLPAR
jgi:lipoprotein NlpD